MTLALLIAAMIMITCILCNRLSNRIGLPALFVFIALGLVFGSDGIFKIPFEDFSFAERICSTALIFIMFYGGFGTKWSAARPVATKAILLSSAGVVMTALLTGLFCHLILGMELLSGLLIGSVLSSTDAASVFSILRSNKLNLKYGTASLLELESGSNDPCSYMMTVIMLTVMGGGKSPGGILLMALAQIGFGLLFGFLTARGALWFLDHFQFDSEGFDTIFVFALAILSYAVPAIIGGNGYLSAYITGILIGNAQIPNKKALVNFFDVFNGLMQMLIFFLLGLLAFPSRFPPVILPALAIALFMTFIGRPAVTAALLAPFKTKFCQQLVVSWAGLRGAASIVFAIMVTVSGVDVKYDVYHIVFCIVLLSIAFQGSLLPLVAKKAGMIDDRADVMKTFNDYTDDTEIQFIRLPIGEGNPWIGRQIQELTTPPGTLLVTILRGERHVVPRGDTRLSENDVVVLGAESYQDRVNTMLSEFVLESGGRWCGKRIRELAIPRDRLIIMIRRDHKTIIPDGNTLLLAGDVVVLISNRYCKSLGQSL